MSDKWFATWTHAQTPSTYKMLAHPLATHTTPAIMADTTADATPIPQVDRRYHPWLESCRYGEPIRLSPLYQPTRTRIPAPELVNGDILERLPRELRDIIYSYLVGPTQRVAICSPAFPDYVVVEFEDISTHLRQVNTICYREYELALIGELGRTPLILMAPMYERVRRAPSDRLHFGMPWHTGVDGTWIENAGTWLGILIALAIESKMALEEGQRDAVVTKQGTITSCNIDQVDAAVQAAMKRAHEINPTGELPPNATWDTKELYRFCRYTMIKLKATSSIVVKLDLTLCAPVAWNGYLNYIIGDLQVFADSGLLQLRVECVLPMDTRTYVGGTRMIRRLQRLAERAGVEIEVVGYRWSGGLGGKPPEYKIFQDPVGVEPPIIEYRRKQLSQRGALGDEPDNPPLASIWDLGTKQEE